ncbi:CHASE3 domain sensor protein [Pontibacter aydingkolensis]|uniref:Uncharacterized protein n=1 Tax=Pontibacter aydingkolensis TaxID=1911536 RepID=A0ABS7CYY0_9BACT|nr:hypothetical protein [Pontibacter aydingkolensis]MBW7469073.1 hypothetical protein [Pontibacter aydingkolensis]
MKPEDIDKIFKERLGNTSPTPPLDLWSKLQDRMEDEMPRQSLLTEEKKEEKKSFLWIYSSIAASLSLLLAVGVVFYNIKTTPEISEQLADKDKVLLQESPAYKAPATETLAQAEIKSEKNSETQATEDAAPASSIAEPVEKPATIAKATKAVQQTKAAQVIEAPQPTANVQQAIAATTPVTEKPAETATVVPTGKPVMSSALAVSSDMNARPVEITIKRAATLTVATAEVEESEPSGLDKKARLAKNIFKQARNLANGEQVQLADLGIRADRVALETQIGKQKFSKVINL